MMSSGHHRGGRGGGRGGRGGGKAGGGGGGGGGQKHTIVLIQTSQHKNSRTFEDFPSVSAAMEGVLKLYERELQRLNPTVKNLTYDIKDLYDFMDKIPDMSCLVFDPSLNAYSPYNKDWMKQRLLIHLQKLAAQ
ncbi:positive regulation of Notch signaling pathway [Balamuthia mandrillaris]